MSLTYAGVLMDMGFSKDKVEKALEVTGNQGVEPAMEWLLAHSEELDQQPSCSSKSPQNVSVETTKEPTENIQSPVQDTAPSEEQPVEEAKSLKCNDCGKLFTNEAAVEFHATKTGHANFSESTEEKKPLSEEEKQEQLRLLENRIKEKRREREEKEKAEALERERIRIKAGKEMVAARKKLEDEEIRKAVEQRRREKEEDRIARQKVKDQIEADKAARRAKQSGEPIPEPAPTPAPAPVTKPAPVKDYAHTRIQIRLTNGQALTQSFGSKEQLSAVRLFVEMNRTDEEGPFSLMTTFPRKVFSDEDFDKPLDILGLVPSAVIIVSKSATS